MLSRQVFICISSILAYPKDKSIRTSEFRIWVQKKFFLDGRSIRLKNSEQCIAVQDNIYCHLRRCHLMSNHANPEDTWKIVKSKYSYIPKDVVTKFVASCPICVDEDNSKQSSPGSSSSVSLPSGSPDSSSISHGRAGPVSRGNVTSAPVPSGSNRAPPLYCSELSESALLLLAHLADGYSQKFGPLEQIYYT